MAHSPAPDDDVARIRAFLRDRIADAGELNANTPAGLVATALVDVVRRPGAGREELSLIARHWRYHSDWRPEFGTARQIPAAAPQDEEVGR